MKTLALPVGYIFNVYEQWTANRLARLRRRWYYEVLSTDGRPFVALGRAWTESGAKRAAIRAACHDYRRHL